MDKEKFIEAIAAFIVKYAPLYNIKVCSPIIAQAILESSYGTSELAEKAHNYFGLQYRKNRCKTCIGVYNKVGSEQNAAGFYESFQMQWCKFEDMENGVIGYFDFINTDNYSNLKGVDSPTKYLELIKSDRYATSLNYVHNLERVIEEWQLTKYDKKRETSMSNSPLVVYTNLSPNHSGARTHAIDRITPHCVVGQLSAESICGCFTSPTRGASCNYGIGSDGSVSMSVEEKNRSWCSSSNANDQRAVTIECASDKTHPYAMNDVVYDSLIKLCVDICQRNGKSKLLWFGDKNKTLAYQPKDDEMIITVHRWFANKSCPGDWLYERLGELASRVTGILAGIDPSIDDNDTVIDFPDVPFSVKVIIDDLNYRSEPSMSGEVLGQTGKGVFTIVEISNGWGRLKSGAGWIWLGNEQHCTIIRTESKGDPENTSFIVRVKIPALRIRKGPGTNYDFTGSYVGVGAFTIIEVASGVGSDTGWGRLKSGAGWISLDYTERIN